MIIISDYTLVFKEGIGICVESNCTSHICPICHGALHFRDSRWRIRKREGGVKEHIIIRRFRCEQCSTYHNELPDCLVPYKHYDAEVISGVLDGVVSPNDLDSEDYPSRSTMHRWKQWFDENRERIQGYLRAAGCSLFGLGEDFLFSTCPLLDSIRSKYPNWLEKVLRLVYNGGGFLIPVRW